MFEEILSSTQNVLIFSVKITSYEGYWIQKSEEKILQCYGQNETILHCEDDSCITNCLSTYEVQDTTATSRRDSNVIGQHNLLNEIDWGNNNTWLQKGMY